MDRPVGRGFDAWLAERYLGWQWFDHPEQPTRYFRPSDVFRYGAIAEGDLVKYTNQLPRFADDLSAAWLIADSIERMGYWADVGICNAQYGPRRRCWATVGEYGDGGAEIQGYGDTPGEALGDVAWRFHEWLLDRKREV